MENFTFETQNRTNCYETYEWDNAWVNYAENLDRTRVLYIGDSISISCATRSTATAKTNEKILFDGFGTSKAVDNPYFKDSIKLFGMQQSRRDAVIFNNGLHGWHLNEETEYKYHFEEMVKFLLKEFEGTPLLIVLTTHIADAGDEKRVIARNKVA